MGASSCRERRSHRLVVGLAEEEGGIEVAAAKVLRRPSYSDS